MPSQQKSTGNLSERLKTLSAQSVGLSAPCPVGRITTLMDTETKQAFFQAMKSEAPTMAIHKALAAENIGIARKALADHRQCFRDKQQECKCFNTNGETK
jgi:hypothetical protein